MTYDNLREAVFLRRPNRFVAEVTLDGRLERVHVKNTGRCAVRPGVVEIDRPVNINLERNPT